MKRETYEEIRNLPQKPKKPLTPYFRFMKQIRPELTKEIPKAKLTDFVKECALRWEKVDPQVL